MTNEIIKIKLKEDLPIRETVAKKGATFDVIRFENRGRGQNHVAVFLLPSGKECAAFKHEYEVLK